MHTVCGYLIKSTWLKAIKAGSYVGWSMLNERNVQKYYPKTIKTAESQLNRTRKNVCSTKAETAPLETCNTSQFHGKKVQDAYTRTYTVHKTMFSDQTGQFPTRSQQGNKYIMVMVEIDSNAILVEPMKSRKDEEMIRAYNALLLRLKQAGIVPKKPFLDNKVSENIGISATWMSPMQYSRGGHTQLQSPFPQRPGWRSQQFSPKPMGLAPPTNRDHDQPHPTI